MSRFCSLMFVLALTLATTACLETTLGNLTSSAPSPSSTRLSEINSQLASIENQKNLAQGMREAAENRMRESFFELSKLTGMGPKMPSGDLFEDPKADLGTMITMHNANMNTCRDMMNAKEPVAGTTLYLPVSAKGALFMAADAHGAQGDGEVNMTALETYIEEAEFQFIVRKDFELERPMAENATHWIVMGFHQDLDEAMKIALKDSIDFLVRTNNLTKNETYAVCSSALDCRVIQVVDGNKGVHAMIPKDIFK